jgi:hypothetical protein
MKPDGLLKPAGIVLIVSLVVYIAAYSAIEHQRNRKGPWRVTFTTESSGEPKMVVDQPRLAITNVCLVFPGRTASLTDGPVVLSCPEPRPVPFPVPFGRCVFLDTTTLPGTIVFEVFGHEIQLLPRVLTIDKREHPWHSNETIPLGAAGGPPPVSVPK